MLIRIQLADTGKFLVLNANGALTASRRLSPKRKNNSLPFNPN